MEVPKIETFEYDISDEIKKKEASIGDIASAGGSLENKNLKSGSQKTFLLMAFLLVIILGGAGGLLGYFIYQKKQSQITQDKIKVDIINSTPSVELANNLPIFNQKVGRFVSKMEKNQFGSNLTLNEYSPVFAYVIKNEYSFSKEMSDLLGVALDYGTSSGPIIFNDTIVSNQNMRVLTNGTNKLVYAFVGTKHLLLSDTVEGILSMKNLITR